MGKKTPSLFKAVFVLALSFGIGSLSLVFRNTNNTYNFSQNPESVRRDSEKELIVTQNYGGNYRSRHYNNSVDNSTDNSINTSGQRGNNYSYSNSIHNDNRGSYYDNRVINSPTNTNVNYGKNAGNNTTYVNSPHHGNNYNNSYSYGN